MSASGRLVRLSPAVLCLVACGGGAAPAPAPEPAPLAVVAEPADSTPARVDTVTVRDAALDQRVNRLELQLLEKDAQIDQLQGQLEEARLEVVRAMAKLRTLATRAEAASAMAEAEVAVQGLGTRRGAGEVATARRLLEQGQQEFTRENYGGALYLANSAKALAAGARGRADGRGGVRGEVALVAQVRMEATGRTNVRAAPGTEAAVLFVVERGDAVQALAYAGDWMRVSDTQGRSGWMIRARLARAGAGDGSR